MAHELAMIDGRASMAYLEGVHRWHGLGQPLKPKSTIEEWLEAAYMNFDIERAEVQFADNMGLRWSMPSKHVLYRSDNKLALGVVSPQFKLVQPREILEFFRDLVANAGMELKTAGVLFNGARFWAMADTGKAAMLLGNNEIRGNLLLCTACDGTMATSARFTSVDVVCNNTLSVAVRSGSNIVRIPHSVNWKPNEVKRELGLISDGWNHFIDEIKMLADTPIDRDRATEFLLDLYEPVEDKKLTTLEERMQGASMGTGRICTKLWDLFQGEAQGANLEGRKGTWWGLVSAVTEYYDYHTGHKSPDARIASAWFGENNNLKSKALELAVASCSY